MEANLFELLGSMITEYLKALGHEEPKFVTVVFVPGGMHVVTTMKQDSLPAVFGYLSAEIQQPPESH